MAKFLDTANNIELDPYIKATYAVNSNMSGGLEPRLASQLQNYGQQFKTFFENYVGRTPTQDEASQFFKQGVQPNLAQITTPGSNISENFGDFTKQFIADNYLRAAQDYAAQQLQSQQDEANRLSGVFRNQGRQAISDTEARLKEYQTGLFEKLRPQLLTSLQAQGLLNTGGLNEAFGGAAKALANETSNYLTDANLQNEMAANQIAFSGASAPYEFARNAIISRPDFLQTQGQAALNRNHNNFLKSLDFRNQIALQNNAARLQADMQPGLLGRLGQNFVSSFGQSAGGASGEGASSFTGTGFLKGMNKIGIGGF